MAVSGEQIVNQGMLYLNGVNMTWLSNTTISVSSGQVRDNTNQFDMVLPAAVTLNMATVGANGLDTGVIAASTMYNIWLIGDSTLYRPTAVIATAANPAIIPALGPVMPFGYDIMKYIGCWATDASAHLLLGYWAQSNLGLRVFKYDAPQATSITAGASATYAPVVLTNFVPSINNVLVSIASAFTPAAASNVLNLQPLNATGNAVTITGQVAAVVINGLNDVLAQLTAVTFLPEINYKVSGGTVAINVAGFALQL